MNTILNQTNIPLYVSPTVDVMDFELELFTGSVLGGSMGIDDWGSTTFPETTL